MNSSQVEIIGRAEVRNGTNSMPLMLTSGQSQSVANQTILSQLRSSLRLPIVQGETQRIAQASIHSVLVSHLPLRQLEKQPCEQMLWQEQQGMTIRAPESQQQAKRILSLGSFGSGILTISSIEKVGASLLAFYGGFIAFSVIGLIWFLAELSYALGGNVHILRVPEALIGAIGMVGIALELILGLLADIKQGRDTCTSDQKSL